LHISSSIFCCGPLGVERDKKKKKKKKEEENLAILGRGMDRIRDGILKKLLPIEPPDFGPIQDRRGGGRATFF
jgi:hypothetical protein